MKLSRDVEIKMRMFQEFGSGKPTLLERKRLIKTLIDQHSCKEIQTVIRDMNNGAKWRFALKQVVKEIRPPKKHYHGRAERNFKKRMTKKGWKVFRAGDPDFKIVNPETGEVILVEVKRGGLNKLSKRQRESLSLYKYMLGLKVKIYNANRCRF